mgnify:CR=1 FL=1
MMHDSTYKAPSVDHLGFLDHPEDWTEDFARQTAPIVGITQGLTDRHWAVIRYLRSQFEKTGRCPLLYFVCSDNGLSVADLQALFPSGYLRGACRLAGISYRDSILCSPVSYTHLRAHETPEHLVCRLLLEKKKYYY